MTPTHWTYPVDLLAALGDLGLAPTSTTPPAAVRDALNDLYRYELRRLRDKLLAGIVVKPDYLDLVVALRKKYWPLTMPLDVWEKVCALP